jgi:hypothetical protein
MQMTLEDDLTDITADLVQLEENSPFLERLFSLQAGVWEDAAVLCHDLGHRKDQIEQLQKQLPGKLQVTWIEYPKSAYGSGYCVIIFFAEELHWSNVALYNKAWFSRNLGQRKKVVK